jgi:TIR domain
VAGSSERYDVFLSYARSDDKNGAVSRLSERLSSAFSEQTGGQQLRVFLDRQQIQNAQMWKARVDGALRASTVLLSVVSAAYFGSPWCRSEWDHFVAREREPQEDRSFRGIFQVCLDGGPELGDDAPATVQRWLRDSKARHWTDLGGAAHDSAQYAARVSELTEHIVGALRVSADGLGSFHDPEVEYHNVVSGYVNDSARFVRLLAEAVNVTIVGLTNEALAVTLADALNRKRARSDDRAFWRSLRVVFVGDKLLEAISDERARYPDRKEAVRQRRLAATWGRRSVSVLLRRAPSSRWALYESPYLPPLAGTLFEMPDGRRIVQLLIRRPQRGTADHLFLEFEDTTDQYFTAAFEAVVHNSVDDNKIVPVGDPRDGDFQCTGSRFRQSVLTDRSGTTGWLPLVLIVTWRNRNGHAEPLLQLRTETNAARELNRLSHLSGYIYQDDYLEPGEEPGRQPTVFHPQHPALAAAARRRVLMEIGDDPPGELRPGATYRYLHSDKEHLFFFMFTLELPGWFQFPRLAEMHHFPVTELMAVRRNQVLRSAVRVCRSALSPRVRLAAAEIVSLNLTLHGEDGLGAEFLTWAQGRAARSHNTVQKIRRLEKKTRQTWFAGGREIQLTGLSGLQYREFFTMLLPLYAEIGVFGAAEQVALIQQDEPMRHAMNRLAALYQDEDLMTSIPIEV